MSFELVRNGIAADFIVEESAYTGVAKITEKVCQDIKEVTTVKPIVKKDLIGSQRVVIVGTLGKSTYLQKLEEQGNIDFTSIRNKWETFCFQIIEQPFEGIDQALVIAGSDKRGTIYGLFHISDLLKISPWVRFADVFVTKSSEIIFADTVCMTAKEPSVKYRGFFINDEWPAFGNWTFEQFGGFNANMYDMIFETLLRLKGNYLWPAMWTSSFCLDGPGEANAILADEYGIVISNSHHEPCLRHSEEWDMVRGEQSIYGKEWNYVTNKEGLLTYWKDGLKQRGKYDTIITLGMRGERDSSMLGKEASLKQNIDLLKDIIKEQKKLIKEVVENWKGEVPKMLALYKEVEAYFYGDDKNKGLMGWEGLDEVTLMLCEDNYGNMRTLPTKELQNHKGGLGMYYHFDYHGGPISYEWVNSSYLPKIWDQMTRAYEYGISTIWVVNVGDLKFQEYPLSFFMDLAYDYETWGSSNLQSPNQYVNYWVEREFGSFLRGDTKEVLTRIIKGYTRLNYNKKPEAMTPDTYHPVHFDEAEQMLTIIDSLERMLEQVKDQIVPKQMPAYWELVYYPAKGSINVHKMNLYAGLNQYFAKMRAMVANDYADKVTDCIDIDKQLTKEFHELLDGKWKWMAQSEHIGFKYWNEEECEYPLRMYVEPSNKPRLLAYSKGEDSYTAGGDWTGKRIKMKQFLTPKVAEGVLVLQNASAVPVAYSILCDCKGITCSKTSGTVDKTEYITVKVDRFQLQENMEFVIQYDGGNIKVDIMYDNEVPSTYPPMTFPVIDGYACIKAKHYADKKDALSASIHKIEDYGKSTSALKVIPCNQEFEIKDAPYFEYHIWAKEAGNYKLMLYSLPANPIKQDTPIVSAIKVNEAEVKKIKLTADGYRAGECDCIEWCQMVLNQIRITQEPITCTAGMNKIRIFFLTSEFALEKIVIALEDKEIAKSYLGPTETYYEK